MTWVGQAPAFALAALVIVGPGLVVGAAAGLRRVALVTTAPLLGYGALVVSIILGSALHRSWGLVSVLLGTLALALVAAVVGVTPLLVRRLRAAGRVPVAGERLLDRIPRQRRRLAADGVDVALVTVMALLAGLTTLLVLVPKIGPPDSVQQSFDAVFHLNAIARVVDLGSASPGVVSQTANLHGAPTFYPPLFHAVAALVVQVCGVGVPVAANVTALTIACLVWPLSILGLVWSLAPRRTTIVAAAAVVTVLAAFPTMLLWFGVLWPNLMGLAALPGAIALLAGLLAPVRPPGGIAASLLCGLVGAVGLYYAHPGTLFAAIALCLAMIGLAVLRLAVVLGRQVSGAFAGAFGPALGVLTAVLVVVAAWFLGAQLWFTITTMPEVEALRVQDWKAFEPFSAALGEALTYAAVPMHPLYLLAALTLAGAGVVLEDRRVWLVGGHGVALYLYCLAAGTDDEISLTLTGFWYNDRYRILAMAAITGVPLAALGITWATDRVRGQVVRLVGDRRLGLTPGVLHHGLGAACLLLVLALCAWATPLTHAWGAMQNLAQESYEGQEERVLTTPPEVALYESLREQPDPDAAVAGYPFDGSALAGTLSGRPYVFGHLRNVLDADQTLVAQRFRHFTTDRAVCRAVEKLDIGYVTEDTSEPFPTGVDQQELYSGLRGLAGTPGLTKVAQEGTVTAYRVGDCRS